MNKASFLTLVRQASRISDQDVEELEKLVINFPYCQTAHLLIAKAAYDNGSMLSNQKLKKAAIYAANRQLLKKLIYTSDATVSLQPLETETVAETPEKVITPEIKEAALTQIPETETQTEVTAENPAEGNATKTEITGDSENIEAYTTALTVGISIAEPEEISEPDYEDAAIAAEILEEEINGLIQEITVAETSETFGEKQDPETALKASADIIISEQHETETIAGIENGETELQEITAYPEPEIPEEKVDPENETSTEETVVEPSEKVNYIPENAAESLNDVTQLHELVLENAPETISQELLEEIALAPESALSVAYLNDELLQDTLASFDQYLFRPEKETAENTPAEDLKVVNPEDVVQSIFEKDTLGYWMSSSRLGESLQFKNELTTPQPYDFHPELLWEYSKTHELQKEIKPAASKLSHQLDIIDNFLKMTPRLKAMAHQKVRTEAQEDLSSKSSKISKNLASENFANILVQQGKIKKAIKIYEHLILKIPEKKAYFVAQIEKLQNGE